MALPTIAVIDANDDPQTINTPNDGRQAAADSQAVVLSTEDLAALSAVGATVTATYTRPADTTAYAANDSYANSTSAPAPLTFTDAARASGGSGVISDLIVWDSADPATTLQGELWLFDASVTATNDNAAFTALSDADVAKLVAIIPFALGSSGDGSDTNSVQHIQGLGVGFTCVGTANLFGLVKVKNAYTPVSAETLNFRLKIQRTS